MQTFTKISVFLIAMLLATSLLIAQSQINFQGLYSEGEGGAAWDADGSGPEPYGNGHLTVYYYTASRDYVDPTCSSGAHMLDNMSGFPLFEQALLDNGFTAEQVTLKISLASMGDDIEGIDWFTIGNVGYANFYPAIGTVYLNGAPLFEAIGTYALYISPPSSQEFESGYLKVNNIAGNSPDPVKSVAAALMSDLGNEELKFYMQVTNAAYLSGNGRSGGYFDVNCSFVKGLPTLPYQGLYADNEGTAGWNADGTGPEPYGNGHGDIVYYSASVDYDGINPDPDACLAHVIEGSDGFGNTLLQLQYRGYEVGDLKLKMGLCSLGPDVEGEDWGYENGFQWLNEYNNSFTIELNGEPILEVLQDTNKMTFINPGTVTWSTKSSVGKVYNISANASVEAQYVAQSFLKDLGSHYLITDVSDIHYVGPMPSGNGRSGVYYELGESAMIGVHEQATFIPEGTVSGTWTAENSPYYVDGHLEIANGETLTIEPGVRIGVRGPYHFDVQGCVKAEGTADENIVFTRSNPNLWWDGIDFNETPVENDTSVFNHCIFQYGLAQGTVTKFNSGGALGILNVDKIRIQNSIFRHNKAEIPGFYPPSGGAIAFENSDLLIQKCTFYDNYSEYGGAIFAYSHANPIISNSLIYNNTSIHGGACCFYEQCDGILINNTIADNTGDYGGAFYFYYLSEPEIINNILWGNQSTLTGAVAYFSQSSGPGFYYNAIEGGDLGFSGYFNGGFLFNHENDPLFETSPDYPPYMISSESPCMDAGTPDTSAWYYPQYLPQTCLGGNPRIWGTAIDMGAYELFYEGIEENGEENGTVNLFNHPNPFTGSTTIGFTLTDNATVKIEIYNQLGQLVTNLVNETLAPGIHQVEWQAGDVPEGVYLCKLKTDKQVVACKILKTK